MIARVHPFIRWLVIRWLVIRWLACVGIGLGAGVVWLFGSPLFSLPAVSSSPSPRVDPKGSVDLPVPRILAESWQAYRQQFIQADGRVIDREANQRSISEGQAYAMWRAVLIQDQQTFDRVWNWGEQNLNAGVRGQDSLWAWTWGQRADGSWGVLDRSVASDADLDAALSLIWAARQWKQERYLAAARRKLSDLWTLCTAEVKGSRYFLPGEVMLFSNTDTSPDRQFSSPAASGVPSPTAASNTYKLNPSYWAPYAWRIFAQEDPQHDWLGMVDSTYALLNQLGQRTSTGLVPDWILINRDTGALQPILTRPNENHYSFDAYRLWWRLALDARYFSQSPAPAYLKQHLAFLQGLWRQSGRIPATLTVAGQAVVTYESTAHYGALYPALVIVDPVMAKAIKTQKLDPVYSKGIWDSNTAYYTQNLVWMGLSAGELPPSALLSPVKF